MIAIVAAHNEADRIGATLTGLGEAFEDVSLWVADDGSSDRTAEIAAASGALVIRARRRVGKGRAMTLAARKALASVATASDPVVLLCDGDLGESAARLLPLALAVQAGEADLAVAVFSKRMGGGFGIALGFARWAVRRRCGFLAKAPLSGQRAMRASQLEELLPFARGYGMEMGMTIDAVRAGMRVRELELELTHRATGRAPAGFLHRGRQLLDCVRVYAATR
ncbi:MAG TPA: glycosyltransferase [Solirubrobacteraceae bacterium]|nr:glycosyltransferase [Solirubrobacteraceae bacterium]